MCGWLVQLISPEGEIVQAYRKVHLFDVDIKGGSVIKESNTTIKGDKILDPYQTPLGKRESDRYAIASLRRPSLRHTLTTPPPAPPRLNQPPPALSLPPRSRPPDLLRPPLPRSLPLAPPPRRPDPDLPLRLHDQDRRGPLDPPPPCPRDRDPVVRPRPRPDGRARAGQDVARQRVHRRPVGDGRRAVQGRAAGEWGGRGGVRAGRDRPGVVGEAEGGDAVVGAEEDGCVSGRLRERAGVIETMLLQYIRGAAQI